MKDNKTNKTGVIVMVCNIVIMIANYIIQLVSSSDKVAMLIDNAINTIC